MATTIQDMPPIARGYVYAFELKVTGGEPAFPAGATFRGEIRDYAGADALAGVVSTAAGSLRRIDDTTIEVQIDGLTTGRLTGSTASIDFVRTDGSPEQFTNIAILLPVAQPSTRPVIVA